MITSIQFKNFKCLRDTTLPLERFTLLIGPNGSGKTTALEALAALREPRKLLARRADCQPAGSDPEGAGPLVTIDWAEGEPTTVSWDNRDGNPVVGAYRETLGRIRAYELDAPAMVGAVHIHPGLELQANGANLAGVLDQMQDTEPERFEQLNGSVHDWLPEFNRVLLETTAPGHKAFLLRTTSGRYQIPARHLSQGTLLALAMLCVAYLPAPPSVVALEEPDRGLHPRLLRRVSDALYRLAYPEDHGEDREPTQVIATTHSPYLLDCYKDHPEEVVIAEKDGLEARFEKLSNHPNYDAIVSGSALGEIWYTGLLGGVPVEA